MSVKCDGCGDHSASDMQASAMAFMGRALGGNWKWWCDDCAKKGLPQEDGRRFWAAYWAKKEEGAKEQREFDERVELACERYRKATETQR